MVGVDKFQIDGIPRFGKSRQQLATTIRVKGCKRKLQLVSSEMGSDVDDGRRELMGGRAWVDADEQNSS